MTSKDNINLLFEICHQVRERERGRERGGGRERERVCEGEREGGSRGRREGYKCMSTLWDNGCGLVYDIVYCISLGSLKDVETCN